MKKRLQFIGLCLALGETDVLASGKKTALCTVRREVQGESAVRKNTRSARPAEGKRRGKKAA